MGFAAESRTTRTTTTRPARPVLPGAVPCQDSNLLGMYPTCHLKADEDSDAQKHFAVPRSGLLVLVPNGNYASVVRWGATE